MGIDPVTHKPISELLRDIAAVEDARATGGASAAAGLGNPVIQQSTLHSNLATTNPSFLLSSDHHHHHHLILSHAQLMIRLLSWSFFSSFASKLIRCEFDHDACMRWGRWSRIQMVAGEEARRCFSDNLLRKAVRDYTRTSSTAAAAAGPSKYDSLSCAAATDHVFNLDHQSCSDHQQLGRQTADHCDVSAMAHSSLIQNEAAAEDDLHSSWEHSITSTTRSNCSMQAGGQDNNSCCSDQLDAPVELSSCCRSSSCSRSPAASDRGTTFQSLQQVMNSSPSRSCKNNTIMQHQSSSSSFQSAAAVICMQQAAAACEEPAIGCRRNNFNLVTDQCLAADTSYCNPATSNFHQQLSAATAASDRTSSTSSNSLVSACSRPAALHFLPMQQDHHHAAAHLPAAAAAACSSSWPCSTIMNGTACTSCCSASYLDHQQTAIPSSTNMKLQQLPPTSCMRFSTVEQPDLQLLQMKRLQQQQQPTGLANFNYHPAAAEAAATAASVTAPAPRFSHSILQQQQQEEDFKRPQSSLHQQLMQQQDHHRHHPHHRQLDQVVSSSRAARRQYNQSPAASFNLQQASAVGSQEAAVAAAPYLSLREPLSPVAAAAYNNTDPAAVTPAAPQLLLSSFAARPPAAAAAAPLSSFNGTAAALISSFSSSTAGPMTHVAQSTGIRTAHSHHYDLQSPRMVLWDFQE